jgi:aldehyde dehydrogenase (NAD+)
MSELYSGESHENLIKELRNGLSQNIRDYKWRMAQLSALKNLLIENDQAISSAMWKDLRKSPFECKTSEQGLVLAEIKFALKNLKKWMKPKKVKTPIYNQPGRSFIVQEPLGLALIIGAWNYPINLILAPLVGAIAGGNAAIIKPSEISTHTAKLLGELIPKYLDKNLFAVVQGAAEETNKLLDHKFDLIFFTGSSAIGKIILQKAAVHLTPVVLELGGKSPAIVMSDADLEVAARRIVWGKFMNAGQTCVAPDYVLCQLGLKVQLVAALRKYLIEFYGTEPISSPDYCRIVNAKYFDRLAKIVEDLTILHGGGFDRDKLFISPTIVEAQPNSQIMQEEIFGPLLPIVELTDLSKIIEFVNSRPKPLALYLFTNNRDDVDKIISSTSSGSVSVNDVVMHMPMHELPFGGVGASGMGQYHGEFGFKTFTHAKGVLKKTFYFDSSVRYPPYSEWKDRLISWLQ